MEVWPDRKDGSGRGAGDVLQTPAAVGKLTRAPWTTLPAKQTADREGVKRSRRLRP